MYTQTVFLLSGVHGYFQISRRHSQTVQPQFLLILTSSVCLYFQAEGATAESNDDDEKEDDDGSVDHPHRHQ